MLARLIKRLIRQTVSLFGYEIRRRPGKTEVLTAPPPIHGIGSMEEFLLFLRSLDFSPRCVLDVGAHETRWATMAVKIFPDARFVLIEPQEELVPGLIAFTNSHPSARCVRAGAGAESGAAIQTIYDDLSGSTFTLSPDERLLQAGRQRLTPIVTIDEVFAEESRLPDLVKLDVQGFELEALKGASRLFGYTECFILEVSLFGGGTTEWPGFYDVVDFMHRRGYQVYDICGFLRRQLDDALGQVDLAFVKSDGRLGRDHRWSREYDPPPEQT